MPAIAKPAGFTNQCPIAFEEERRFRSWWAIAAKPISIMVQLAGSGTADTGGVTGVIGGVTIGGTIKGIDGGVTSGGPPGGVASGWSGGVTIGGGLVTTLNKGAGASRAVSNGGMGGPDRMLESDPG